MKLAIAIPKPRNPLASPARLRLAGRHQAGRKTERQRAVASIRSELNRARTERHDP